MDFEVDLNDVAPATVSTWDGLFPFPSFRAKQKDVMEAAVNALHNPEIDNVVVDAPTGVGKSAINVAAARTFDSSFYITPQKKLRRQLQQDAVLNDYYKALRGRRDYTCGVSGSDCESCEINRGSGQCRDYARNSKYSETHDESQQCTYWNNKLEARNADTAVLTFAYLVIDSRFLPPAKDGKPVSFGDRDLLIVDECHGLENQVASLFAGFKVSPWTIPPNVYRDIARHLDMDTTTRHHEVMDIMETLRDRCRAYKHEHKNDDGYGEQVDDCRQFIKNAEWFFEEVNDWDKDWVVDMDRTRHPDKNKKVKSFTLKPVRVDSFLQNFVWSRASNRLLTTATLPYRGDPNRWIRRIGLDPARTHFLWVQMPFPASNRPIHVHTEVAEMSGGGDDRNWDGIMAELERLAGKHSGENGLVHTASYKRAERIYKSVKTGGYPNLSDNVLFHDAEKDSSAFIDRWQASNENIVLSPSMMEGVDLKDDMCRWQVLLKVPYPNMGDSRVDYLMDDDVGYGADWQWYYETTAQSIIQSAGRAVRSKTDYADYYVLDESFEDVRRKVSLPDWFQDAITTDPSNSAQTNAVTPKTTNDPLEF